MATVADALLTSPKTHRPDISVGAARTFFTDDHVHALLLVREGVLAAVVERDDLAGVSDNTRARAVGRLAGRVIGPQADLEATRLAMAAQHRRRLAVVDQRGLLLGLLCLKRHGRGFCSSEDVAAREAERASNRAS